MGPDWPQPAAAGDVRDQAIQYFVDMSKRAGYLHLLHDRCKAHYPHVPTMHMHGSTAGRMAELECCSSKCPWQCLGI